MWIPKWYMEHLMEKMIALERRVKRLELMELREAENKIASLGDKEAGSVTKDGFLTVEEILNKSIHA